MVFSDTFFVIDYFYIQDEFHLMGWIRLPDFRLQAGCFRVPKLVQVFRKRTPVLNPKPSCISI